MFRLISSILGLALGVVLLCPAALIAQRYTVVPNSIRQESISLTDGTLGTRIQFRIKADPVNADLTLTMFYDGKSGLTFWSLPWPDGTALPWVVAKAGDERSLVGFYLEGSELVYRTSTTTAASIAAAQSMVLEEANRQIQKPPIAPTVLLMSALGKEFFFGLSPNLASGEGKVRRVSGDTNGWQLELDGRKSQTATVLLSKDFQILNATVNKK